MSGPVLNQRGLVTWALIGDGLNSTKPAHRVAASIENQGRLLYRVIPTLDAKNSSPKKRIYKTFVDIPPEIQIDAVNLCVNYRIGLGVLEEMKNRGIRYCFMQPGADHLEIIQKATELGIEYQRGCMILEPLLDLDEDEKNMVVKKKKELAGRACNIL